MGVDSIIRQPKEILGKIKMSDSVLPKEEQMGILKEWLIFFVVWRRRGVSFPHINLHIQ